jgi:hypothetical protein
MVDWVQVAVRKTERTKSQQAASCAMYVWLAQASQLQQCAVIFTAGVVSTSGSLFIAMPRTVR